MADAPKGWKPCIHAAQFWEECRIEPNKDARFAAWGGAGGNIQSASPLSCLQRGQRLARLYIEEALETAIVWRRSVMDAAISGFKPSRIAPAHFQRKCL
jgi:hypothetical protein